MIVGCGNIAIYSIAATLITVPNIEKVIISNPKNYTSLLNKIDDIKLQVKKLLQECGTNLSAEIICSDSIEDSVKISDIIITATSSEKTMIKMEWVKEETHFSCMGACMEGKQEIDSNIFASAKIYAYDISQCIKSGESQTPYKEKIFFNLIVKSEKLC